MPILMPGSVSPAEQSVPVAPPPSPIIPEDPNTFTKITGNSLDMTATIRAAIIEMDEGTIWLDGRILTSGEIVVPPTKSIRFEGSGMDMRGGGYPCRVIRTSGTEPVFRCSGTSFPVRGHVELANMTIDGGALAGKGVVLERCNNVLLDRVSVRSCNEVGLDMAQVFNSSMRDVSVSSCGNGAALPAVRFRALAEAQGGCDTVQMTNWSLEGNNGTDMEIDGDAFPAPANVIELTNFKFEGGFTPLAAYPYLNVKMAQNCKFNGIQVTSTRSVTPIQQVHPLGSTRANQWCDVTVDFTTGTAPYGFEVGRIATQITNYTCVSTGTQPSNAALHITSATLAGRIQVGPIGWNDSTRHAVHDERAAPTEVLAVPGAGTYTLPPGEQNPRFVSFSGPGPVTGLTAEKNGTAVICIFGGVTAFTDGGNLKLGGSISTTGDDSFLIVCDGVNWHQVAAISSN